jgi:predicted DNA-binding transcriptional regulator AlpA
MSSNPTQSNKLNASSSPAQQVVPRSTGFDALPNSAYIREAQLVQSPSRPNSTAPLPFSAPTLWRKVRAGTFPKPIKLSERITCWPVGTVRAWLAAQESLAYNPTEVAKKQAPRI